MPAAPTSSQTYPQRIRRCVRRCLARVRSSLTSSSAREVSCGLGLLVGNEHLDHVVGHQLARQELGVVSIVLPFPVAGGLVHLGDCADDAVDAEFPQRADEVESRHPRFVDRLGRFETEDPGGYLRRCVCKPLGDDLARHRVQGDGGDGTSVNIQANRGNMVHREPLSCMWQPGKDCRLFGRDHYQPKDPRSYRRRHEAGAHNVLLISSVQNSRRNEKDPPERVSFCLVSEGGLEPPRP